MATNLTLEGVIAHLSREGQTNLAVVIVEAKAEIARCHKACNDAAVRIQTTDARVKELEAAARAAYAGWLKGEDVVKPIELERGECPKCGRMVYGDVTTGALGHIC